MGFLDWLRPSQRRGVVTGDGAFDLHVVGTSQHQHALEEICGQRTLTGTLRYCGALLSPQPNNDYILHAVAVTIQDVEVGHLERDTALDFLDALHAQQFADAACEAVIVGGWDRGGNDWGYYGVRLNAVTPFEFMSAEVYKFHKIAPVRPEK
jgi:hypothetical protein